MTRIVIVSLVLGLVGAACSGGSGEPATSTTSPAVVSSTAAPGAATGAGSDLVAQDGDLVEVHYVGTLDDGTTFDSSRDRGKPLSFVVGSGQVIPGFDDAVRGMKVGETKTVHIPAADAYGPHRDDLVVEVPYAPSQGDVKAGDRVTLSNGRPAVVLEVKKDTVVLDANHPLAGKDLTFEVEVMSITRQ